MKISNPFENLEGLARWLAYAGIVIFVAIVGAIGVIKLTSAVETRPTLASAETQPTPAAGEMKLKRFWTYEWNRWAHCNGPGLFCAEQFFQCDYTSRTCQRGYRMTNSSSWSGFLFEVLAEDRKTVIEHLFVLLSGGSRSSLSFDTGVLSNDTGPYGNFTVPEDMLESCLSSSRDSRDCKNWILTTIPGSGVASVLAHYPLGPKT